MAVKVQIGGIDMNGYGGRDPHPEPEDSGQVATLLAFQPDQEDTDIFTVRMADGRVLDLVAHEIESLEVDHTSAEEECL